MENHIVTYFNGHSRNPNWRYLPYLRIYKAYFSGLNFRGYTPKIWPNIWYVYVPPLNRILEISHWFFFGSVNYPLVICYIYRHGKIHHHAIFSSVNHLPYFDKWAIEKPWRTVRHNQRRSPWPGARRQVTQVTPQRHGGDSRDEALSRGFIKDDSTDWWSGILMNIDEYWYEYNVFMIKQYLFLQPYLYMIWIDDDFRWLVLYDQSYFGWIVLVTLW